MPITRQPAAAKRRATCRPMKPYAPVTVTWRTISSLHFDQRELAQKTRLFFRREELQPALFVARLAESGCDVSRFGRALGKARRHAVATHEERVVAGRIAAD